MLCNEKKIIKKFDWKILINFVLHVEIWQIFVIFLK